MRPYQQPVELPNSPFNTAPHFQRNRDARGRVWHVMTHNALCVSALALFAAVSVRAQNAQNAQDDRVVGVDRLDSTLEGAFKTSRCPGLSAAVAKSNKVIYSKAFGFADLEQGVPMRTDSVHRLASLSKPVTGMIVMDLVQLGRLEARYSDKDLLVGSPCGLR